MFSTLQRKSTKSPKTISKTVRAQTKLELRSTHARVRRFKSSVPNSFLGKLVSNKSLVKLRQRSREPHNFGWCAGRPCDDRLTAEHETEKRGLGDRGYRHGAQGDPATRSYFLNLMKHLWLGLATLLLTSCNYHYHDHDHSCPEEGHGPCYLKLCCNGHPDNGKTHE